MTVSELLVQNMFLQIRVFVDSEHTGMCAHVAQYDRTGGDVWKVLCETREQRGVCECVVQWEVGVVRIGSRLRSRTWSAQRALRLGCVSSIGGVVR